MIYSDNSGMSAERLERILPAIESCISNEKIAGATMLVARRGRVVYQDSIGLMGREDQLAMRSDTIVRLYSMTKPIVCAALMTLWEKGCFRLIDPVSNYIPGFAEVKVHTESAGSESGLLEPLRPITIQDLFTHTSGLTYSFLEYGPVEEMYRKAGLWEEEPLEDYVSRVLQLPLAFQPGTAWRYSIAHDIVAYLVELLSGLPLDTYLDEELFRPLGMVDTGYYLPEEKLDRFSSLYGSVQLEQDDTSFTKWFQEAAAGKNQLLAGPRDSRQSRPHRAFRGGTGLVSTTDDYWRFCQMLLNGGEFEGIRVLGRKTVELMTTNHLPSSLMPIELGGLNLLGYGFGLGMRTLIDVGQSAAPGSPGEYGWSGAANTYFWIDPVEELIGIIMAQYQPSSYHPLSDLFRAGVYQSIVD